MRDSIKTERLILRSWRESDRLPFREINADPRVMEHFPAPLAAVESDALFAQIEKHFADHGFGPFAVEIVESGAFAGFIGLSLPSFQAPFMPAIEIGWRLACHCWGRGLATEGARAAVRYGFETIGLESIVSFTVPANLRSRRVMAKLGMTHDPADNFDHPLMPEGHALRRHVLYRLAH